MFCFYFFHLFTSATQFLRLIFQLQFIVGKRSHEVRLIYLIYIKIFYIPIMNAGLAKIIYHFKCYGFERNINVKLKTIRIVKYVLMFAQNILLYSINSSLTHKLRSVSWNR